MYKLENLDIKNRKILYELDTNARQTYLQIAKKVGLSKDVVIYRINNLLKRKIINGFHTIIDTSKLGYFTVRVYVKFQNTNPGKEKEIIDYITNLKNALWVGKVEGNWNFVFGLWVKTHKQFDVIWIEFEKKFRQFLQKKEIAIFTEYLHYRRNYLIDKKHVDLSVDVVGASKEVEIDSINFKLLKLLADNARVSLIELTKEVGLTSKAISNRIKQLKKDKIILGYRAMINLNSINYHFYKVDLNLENLDKIKELRSFIMYQPNVVYSERTIGGSDFEFDIECQDFNEFQDIINELKEKLGEIIRDYTYYLATKVYKTLYFPL